MVSPEKPGYKLNQLPNGHTATIAGLSVQGDFRQRLLDLGFVPGTVVKAVLESPDNGLVAYCVKGAKVALRPEDAAKIRIIEKISSIDHSSLAINSVRIDKLTKPSIAYQFTNKTAGQFTIALAGNPNTGKSTVFNALTGLRQHVGNWPGKTVARLEGVWRHNGQCYRIVDLPGTYSLLSQSPEEEISYNFLFEEQPDCVVVVADATCLERNLNLVFQIMELAPRVVLCVNLLDQAQRLGLRIKAEALEKHLGIPVVMTCAHKTDDITRLAEKLDAVIQGRISFCPVQVRHSSALEEALNKMVKELKPYLTNVSACRWVAMRLIDGDKKVRQWFREQVNKSEFTVV